MAQLRDFQKATSERIMEYYDSAKNPDTNRRYLLADEVGLGKTIVAGDVIDHFVKREGEQGRECAVYYVCGNLALIAQNERKLRDGFESFASYEDRRSRHDDMSRLALSFIRDNYKREFEELIQILKGISVWMLSKSEGEKGVYTKDMFYSTNGRAKKIASKVKEEKLELIVKMIEQPSSKVKFLRDNRLQREKDIYRLLLFIYKKIEAKSLGEKKKEQVEKVNEGLKKYKFCDENGYKALNVEGKENQKNVEKEIVQGLLSLASIYDSMTNTKKISFQSLTPRTSIEKTSSGTWVERAAAGIVYYKWSKGVIGEEFENLMDGCIRGKKNEKEFGEILSVIKNGQYAKTECDEAQQAMFLYQNISDGDVDAIMEGFGETIKTGKDAMNPLKAIMEKMSKYSLKKAKENKSVLVVVDEFQNYSKILGTSSEECKKIKETLLQDKEHYVLMLSATPFHFANANIGKESKYSSGLKEIDSEVDLILNYVLGESKYNFWSTIKKAECRYEYLYKNGVSRTERIDQAIKNGNMTLCCKNDKELLQEDLKTLVPALDMKKVFTTIEKIEDGDVVFSYEGYLYVYRCGKHYLANEELITLFSDSECWDYDGYIEDDEDEDDDSKTDKEDESAIKFYQVMKGEEFEGDEEDEDGECDYSLEEYICNEAKKKYLLKVIRENTIPISYIKDTPWILSFTQGYKVPNYSSIDKYMLSAEDIKNYKEIPATHARFSKLQNVVLDKAHKYLFIPPSKPDYTLWGIYEDADYSKSLIFSKNYHTLRAFSAMLSYESERRNLEGKDFVQESNELCADKESVKTGYENRTRYDLFKEGSKESEGNDENCIQKEINRYRELMMRSIATDAEKSPYVRTVEKVRKGEELSKDDMFCLGSIAGYFLELAKKYGWEEEALDIHLERILMALYSVFTTKEAQGILCEVGDENDSYMKKIYAYNAQGNIRAVLDEYFHLILENEHLTMESFQNNLEKKFEDLEKKYFSVIREYMNNGRRFSVKVNTNDCTSINIYTNFAQGIIGAEAKVDTQKALKNKMVCFNSPFRPFVFTTTSVGAEGLDFHWYCSNIYHWTLEMNPEKFQQKEGRINRFHCHGVRRNLGRDLQDKSWDEIYNAASKKEGNPFWPEWVYDGNGQKPPYTELKRHTLYYPGSYEDEAFDEMIRNMETYKNVVNGKYLCPLNFVRKEGETL